MEKGKEEKKSYRSLSRIKYMKFNFKEYMYLKNN